MFFMLSTRQLFTKNIRYNLYRHFNLVKILYVNTHYDTLKVNPNCSMKEIREAFIELSKQCHPDHNQSDPKTHTRFVNLNEAYSILSRPDKRKEYDERLTSSKHYQQQSTSYAKVYPDIYTWDSKGKSHSSQDYYGIRGVKRVSNTTIAWLCIIVASIGVFLQTIAIRWSLTLSREHLDTKSHQTGLILTKVREDAQRHGKERQLELLRESVIRSGVDVPPMDIGKEYTSVVTGINNGELPSKQVAEDMPRV